MRRLLTGVLLLVLVLAMAGGGRVTGCSPAPAPGSLSSARPRLGQPIRIGSATAQLYPRVGVRLRDVRVGEPVRVTLADVALSAGLRPLLARRLEEADVVIADSRVEMPLPFEVPAAATPAKTEPSTDFQYKGDLDLDLRDAATMTLASRVRDVDVAQLAAFGGVPDTMTGRLTGVRRFSGLGSAFAEILSSARGEGNTTISAGTIGRLNLVRTVVLFFGRPASGGDPAHIVLPATIGGTLAAPRLSIDGDAAVKRGLRNEVERRLKGLLDRFRSSN